MLFQETMNKLIKIKFFSIQFFYIHVVQANTLDFFYHLPRSNFPNLKYIVVFVKEIMAEK